MPNANWLRLRFSRKGSRSPRGREPRPYQPNLETLEDRRVPAALTIATATEAGGLDLPPALVNHPLTQSFTALGGTGADVFRITPQRLDGLTFSSAGNVGTLSGTPVAAGAFALTLSVRDAAGNTATGSYTLKVAASPLVLAPATVTPMATVQEPVVKPIPLLTGSGGSGNFNVHKITLAGGAAPDGLKFSVSDSPSAFSVSLTGTPTTAGAFPSFVAVRDYDGDVAIQPFTLLVANSGRDATPLTLYAPLNNGRDLPLATANRAYSQAFGAFGGTGRLTFQTPAEVDGLTFSSPQAGAAGTTVQLTGTPRVPGSFVFNLTVTDQSTRAATYSYTLTVEPASLAVGPALLKPITQGAEYAQSVALLGAAGNTSDLIPFQMSATGGSGTGYVFTATGLPAGMALTSAGVLCGAPAAPPGSYAVDVTVTDSRGHVASRTYTLTVLPAATRFYTPAQVARAYGLDQVNFNGAPGTGKGVTVVIAEDSDDPRFVSSFDPAYRTSDLAQFDANLSLPDFGNQPGQPVFLKLNASGTADPSPDAGTVSSSGVQLTGTGTSFKPAKKGDYIGNAALGYFKIADVTDATHLTLATAPPSPFARASYQVVSADEGEFTMDVEWVHALAPLANIVVLEGPSGFPPTKAAVNWSPGELQAAVTRQLAPGVLAQLGPAAVVSDSIGGLEKGSDDNDEFIPTGPNNVAFVASAGDLGARGSHPGVLWPATSVNVLAAGESELVTDARGNYIGETGVRNTGGGLSAFQGQPAYQGGSVAAFSTTYRTVPDVAFVGSANSSVAVYNSWPPGRTDPWGQGDGTSLAAPAWAALIAVADQGRALRGEPALSSLANSPDSVQALLYKLFRSTPADFHNITDMDDGTANPPGYNLHTGLGSPVANRLIPDLAVGGGATIRGTVFNDFASLGTWSPTSTGVAGVTVFLDLNHDGKLDPGDPTTTTAADGTFSFMVTAANYQVAIVVPVGWKATTADRVLSIPTDADDVDIHFGIEDGKNAPGLLTV